MSTRLPPILRETETSSLTAREKDILLLVARGHPNKTIAEMACLSKKTVRNHITHILKKLRLKRRTQLVCYVWQMGWMGKGESEPEQGRRSCAVGQMSH